MAPQCDSDLVPMGWTLEIEVKKDGCKIPFYYCPSTGQHFYTYSGLMRYVKYAQSRGLGIYQLSRKSVKRQESLEKDSKATGYNKTGSLTIVRKPSSTVGMSLDPKPSTSSGSIDKKKDPDYPPESEINVANQNLMKNLTINP